MYIILTYDISIKNNGQKTQRNIFKTCKKYLSHIQNSTFEGEITEAQLKKMKIELEKHLRKNLDSIIIFKTRTEKWLEKELIGKQEDKTDVFL